MPLGKTDLAPGETVVLAAHLHLVIFAPPLLFVTLGLLTVGGVLSGRIPDALLVPGWLVVAFGCLGAILALVDLFTTKYLVTTERVYSKRGLIARATSEVMVDNVEGVELRQGVAGRILGFGTVVVSGSGTQLEEFRMIAKPVAMLRAVRETVASRRRYGSGH